MPGLHCVYDILHKDTVFHSIVLKLMKRLCCRHWTFVALFSNRELWETMISHAGYFIPDNQCLSRADITGNTNVIDTVGCIIMYVLSLSSILRSYGGRFQ